MIRRALMGALGAAACVSGALRPVSPATEFAVDATPARALDAALGAVTGLGLPLRLHDPAAGVLETDYVDLGQFDPNSMQFPQAERLVRFRVIVVPAETGYGSHVVIEARYSPFATGRGIERRRERAVPADHPAMRLVADLEEAITERAQGL